MKYYLIFDAESGIVLHVHLVVEEPAGAFITLEKKDILSTLSGFFPAPYDHNKINLDSNRKLQSPNPRS